MSSPPRQRMPRLMRRLQSRRHAECLLPAAGGNVFRYRLGIRAVHVAEATAPPSDAIRIAIARDRSAPPIAITLPSSLAFMFQPSCPMSARTGPKSPRARSLRRF